jgi:hypothetical protein
MLCCFKDGLCCAALKTEPVEPLSDGETGAHTNPYKGSANKGNRPPAANCLINKRLREPAKR